MNGLKARDPRHSNVLYSLLVGPVTTGDSPVRLDFRYSKEKEWENSVASAAGVSSPCLESSVGEVLSLFFCTRLVIWRNLLLRCCIFPSVFLFMQRRGKRIELNHFGISHDLETGC